MTIIAASEGVLVHTRAPAASVGLAFDSRRMHPPQPLGTLDLEPIPGKTGNHVRKF
ncbi:hypothetical protein [Agromyces badenianii]|uniref:hypothetical protein n=1 Tax=Agromyces badenianii TaxID=2080742 RepID=UPI00143D0640|nr:hypothetical protein [Agromyces badenianii]